MVNIQKVAMIGCGFVGATSAFSLMLSGMFSEMVLIDINREKAEGEAMEISPMAFHFPGRCRSTRGITAT